MAPPLEGSSDGGDPAIRVTDIRPDELMRDQKAAMHRDIDWLAARRESFVDVACPACGAAERADLYEKYGFRHNRCTNCGTQYVSPRPDSALLATFYANSQNYAYWARHVYPASREVRRERLFRPRARYVADLARQKNLAAPVLVEVGAAYGLFCDEARKTGAFSRVVGIEPTPDLAEICRAQDIEVIERPYELVRLDAPADIVASFEVIEHLFAPLDFVRWCFDALRPGGCAFLTCPNIAGFETSVLGSASETVDHQHLNLMNPRSLARLLERAGFVDVEVDTPGALDVDIVRRAIDADPQVAAAEPFLCRALAEGGEETAADLQAFLARNGLSSHMRAVARRPDVA